MSKQSKTDKGSQDSLPRTREFACTTSGARFKTHVRPDDIGVNVRLPGSLVLSEAEASRLEDQMREALEEILAPHWDRIEGEEPASSVFRPGWNYRVLRYEYHVPDSIPDARLVQMNHERVMFFYKIVEVYYDEHGRPQSYADGKNPVELAASHGDLCYAVEKLEQALRAPVLMDLGPDREEGLPRLVEVPSQSKDSKDEKSP